MPYICLLIYFQVFQVFRFKYLTHCSENSQNFWFLRVPSFTMRLFFLVKRNLVYANEPTINQTCICHAVYSRSIFAIIPDINIPNIILKCQSPGRFRFVQGTTTKHTIVSPTNTLEFLLCRLAAVLLSRYTNFTKK